MNEEIRWKQRFQNYQKALRKLTEATETYNDSADNIIKEGIIQRFEFTHELAWKVMKDFLDYEGIKNISGSRSATREAFNKELIREGQLWMEMIESRNTTVHTYDEAIIEHEFKKIVTIYTPLLKDFNKKMELLF